MDETATDGQKWHTNNDDVEGMRMRIQRVSQYEQKPSPLTPQTCMLHILASLNNLMYPFLCSVLSLHLVLVVVLVVVGTE